MKEKIKRFWKRYLIGFITGMIVCGTVSVIAATYFPSSDVTYDNKTSGLESNNVQGAIDELYNVCTFKEMTPGELVDDIGVVDSGDGLYNDDYEDRYIFKGSNPNNYVTFNNEEAGWRIISIEGDGALKIIKNESVGNIMWGSDYYNEWDSSGVEIYLSNTFYNTLNSIAQSQIVSYNFSTGHEIDDDNLSDIIKNENSEIWNGKVGVIRASEYLRANSNKNCETFSLNNNNYNTCRGTNWMYDSTNWWTLNAAVWFYESLLCFFKW